MQPLEDIPLEELVGQQEQCIDKVDHTKDQAQHGTNQEGSSLEADEVIPLTQFDLADLYPNSVGRSGLGMNIHTAWNAIKEPKKWKRQGEKKKRQQWTMDEVQLGRKRGEYDDMDIDGPENRSRLVGVL